MDQEERRAENVKRVPIETLVEICGQDRAVPPFEAEAVEVSGRGMHVRTGYLPEAGSPLVCRFEDRGREILVEGEVAWRAEDEHGGEFGIKFTALDAGSVEVLRDLCDSDGEVVEATDADPEPEEVEEEALDPLHERQGAKVRLHIDGLGSPMKARVRKGNPKRVDVGSNLEFLKVGKSLEIEEMDQEGERRLALIDSVSVAVDPQSQVPQLVVTLRYEGVDSTPEPAVIDASDEAHEEPLLPSHVPSSRYDELDMVSSDDEIAEEAEAMRGALGNAARSAGVAMSSAGAKLATFSTTASSGVGRWFKTATSKVEALKKKESEAGRPRRTTAPPPSGNFASRRFEKLRGGPATEPSPELQTVPKRGKKKIIAAAAVAGVALCATVYAMSGSDEPPAAETAATPATRSTDVVAVNEQGDPAQPATQVAAAALPAPAPAAPEPNEEGIVADVPLFGPTPMATMEPAPLGAPPDEEPDNIDDIPASKSAPDEAWDDSSAKTQEKKVDPRSVKPWGRGKMHLPVIHRLRLDKPGSAIQGAVGPTGFTIVVPKRKAMEKGKGIAKRDKRIAKFRAVNTPQGAQISFKFKNGVPGYRVRLRKDFVEFLISSPKKK